MPRSQINKTNLTSNPFPPSADISQQIKAFHATERNPPII